jgi:hypothetical protein
MLCSQHACMHACRMQASRRRQTPALPAPIHRAHANTAIADGSDKHAALHALSVCAEAAAALPHERSSVPWSTSMLCEYSKSIINADAVPVVSLHFRCIYGAHVTLRRLHCGVSRHCARRSVAGITVRCCAAVACVRSSIAHTGAAHTTAQRMACAACCMACAVWRTHGMRVSLRCIPYSAVFCVPRCGAECAASGRRPRTTRRVQAAARIRRTYAHAPCSIQGKRMSAESTRSELDTVHHFSEGVKWGAEVT